MTQRLAALAGTLLLAALPAGCGDEASAPGSPLVAGPTGVDVDNAQLRDQRAAAGIATCPRPAGTAGDPVDGGLPAVILPCLGGGPDVDLAALRGPLVVNLWAQWCEPCRRELPYFARLHDSGVEVLGVDFQDPLPSDALSLAEASGVRYPSVADVDGDLRAPLRVAGLPVTVFVDERGEATATLAQEFTSYDQLASAVEEHLGVRP